MELADIICVPQLGPQLTAQNLTAFVDALTAVDKVAEKPADASYSGYIRKFKDNKKAFDRDPAKEKADANKEIAEGQERCQAMAEADLGTASDFQQQKVRPGAAFLPGLATFMAFDALFKSVLGAAEHAQRNAAIIATVEKLTPQLKEAVVNLRAEPNDTFGPLVAYKDPNSNAAKMEKTSLGATITIHRWMVGRRIQMLWNVTARCRTGSPCMDNRKMTLLTDELVDSVYEYRALALVDTDKILDLLDKGIVDAEAAAKNRTLGGILDAIVGIGDTLSGINKKYEDYRKTRE